MGSRLLRGGRLLSTNPQSAGEMARVAGQGPRKGWKLRFQSKRDVTVGGLNEPGPGVVVYIQARCSKMVKKLVPQPFGWKLTAIRIGTVQTMRCGKRHDLIGCEEDLYEWRSGVRQVQEMRAKALGVYCWSKRARIAWCLLGWIHVVHPSINRNGYSSGLKR